jgi:hypothetical protein
MIYTWVCPFCQNAKGSAVYNKSARWQLVIHLKAEHLESASNYLLPLVDREKLIDELGFKVFSEYVFEGAEQA